MAVTVQDLLQLAFPAGSGVVAGASGLRREVVWARSLRPRPPVFEALEGGELALISSAHLSVLEEPMTLPYIVSRLAVVPVAAIAVLGDVDPRALEPADAAGLPLIQLPPSCSLAEVERAAIATIVDRQAELQRKASDIHRQLAQLTFEEKGLQAVAERLAELSGKSVAVEDDQFRLLYAASPPDLPHPGELDLQAGRREIEEWVRTVPLSSAQPPARKFSLPDTGLGRFVAPIPSRDGVAGYLSLIGPEDALADLDRLAAGRGAAVVAVEVAKDAAVGEAEARVRGDLLDQLLSGDLEGSQAALGKARRMGYDPSVPSLVLAFRAGGRGSDAPAASPAGAERVRRRLEPLVRLEMSRRESRSLVASRGGTVVAVVPLEVAPTDRAAREMAEAIRVQAELALNGIPVAVGIGRATGGGTGLAASYREAEGALGIGIRVHGPSSTTHFADLGIMRLLAQVGNLAELESFRGEMLGKLEENDRKTGGELVKTLATLFQCHGNLTRAAEALSLHRNSLLYRIQRIEEISGHDLEDPETRLSLQVALKIRQLQEAERPRG